MAKILKFLAAGLPAFLVAVPLNWLLVSWLGWPKPAAYALVLLVQVTVNFFACFYLVFERRTGRPTLAQYWRFVSGIAAFRAADWAAYTVLVEWVGVPYLAAQLLNVALFAVLKYRFSASVFEGDRTKG
ncbi:MAG: GtrA family protein [Bryobacteraceae bacterium]|nr:GtrA family protein [Bryobacteraceae bacterium]